MLVLNAGTDPGGGTGRAIGQPLLGIGYNGFVGVGDYSGIGLGYLYSSDKKYCCEIGCVITNTAAGECGDLLLSTRTSTNGTIAATERMRIMSTGNITINNNTTLFSSLNVSGITTLSNKTIVNGICNIHGGNPFAVVNNYMQKGSLTIGDPLLNYGGGSNWSSNTAGLLLECENNTEIAVHDAGQRVSSLMYYQGGVSSNKITIGRDMGWVHQMWI
jgi:hypothetical protein